MAPHPIEAITSPSSWGMVRAFSLDGELRPWSQVFMYVAGIQVEDKFSPYAKETLAKLIAFVEVRCPHYDYPSLCTHGNGALF